MFPGQPIFSLFSIVNLPGIEAISLTEKAILKPSPFRGRYRYRTVSFPANNILFVLFTMCWEKQVKAEKIKPGTKIFCIRNFIMAGLLSFCYKLFVESLN